MANQQKEDEKNERIIRGLLKLPENRRCINCNGLGPQYVCTNFWTFVCTTCSGIHREFTHRVKSVSMAKFTSQEVNAIQQGGNQRAKEIYFKECDTLRSVPDSSHVERLRDFIKHVYVDRRYTGEKNYDKPPRGGKEDFYDNRRADSYQGGSRSPPFEERRYSSQSSPGGSYDGRRSPGYEQESRQYGDYGRSPSRPEFVNDWFRDDKFGNGRKDEERQVSDGDMKLDGRSPERPKDIGSSSLPMVRPVREILGENQNSVPLRISEPPKAGGRAVDVSSQTQRAASSSSLGSTNEKPLEAKLETAGSLIDFDSEPEPPAASAVPQAQQSTATLSTTQPENSNNDNNWASFDAFSQTTVTQTRNVNPLESVLSELSISTPVPAHTSGVTATNNPPTVASASNSSTYPLGTASVAAPGLTVNGGNSFVNIYGAGQGPTIQHQQPSLFPSTSNQATIQQFTPVAGPLSIQPWNLSPAQSMQGYLSRSTAQASQPFPKSANEVTSDVGSQPAVADVKLSGRKELPADLFTATYSAFPAAVPGWQMSPPGGMGFPMQYNTAMSMPTLQQSVKTTNPFDISSEPSPVQAPIFPSALPNVLPQSGFMRTSSLGSPSPTWMPQSLPYNPAMPPQAPSYASAMPPRTYMGQQVLSNSPPSGQQGFGSIGAEEAAFGSLNVDQQFAGRFPALATPSPFSSVGGNPFG